jgi:oligopeptide/dipeptide ABC transporter ATP-binding protein
VLVADEPTSSLDVSVQAQILNLIVSLRESRRLTLVLISHDLAVVRYATDEAVVMYGGHVVERGATDRLLAAPLHPYTRVLVDSLPGQEGPARPVENEVDPKSGCIFAARCAHVGADCLERQPDLVRHEDRLVACVRPLFSAPSAARPPARQTAPARCESGES